MSFQGSTFIYDGIPSDMYGLMIANIDSDKQSVGNYGGKLSISEDRFSGRATGLHYGTYANDALSFPITFVVCEDNRHLDRYEQAAISGWLTGHQDYKQLVICQHDMEGVYYNCLITELKAVEAGMRQIGFTATVTCDGPYAYRSCANDVIECGGSAQYLYRNLSNVNDVFRPVITVTCTGTSFSIENQANGTLFTLSGMEDGSRTITIDCLNQVMTSSDGLNLYQYWNDGVDKEFPSFVRGDNMLNLSGNGTVTIRNEFPWNVGF